MLFDILQTITDFAVLVTRLTTEELADEGERYIPGGLIWPKGLSSVNCLDE